ncbi:hypothetical protein ['Camptotheca acuminata' phytoplasma]|uniref:hypothetical protein n=1 Tax='Camptotheca acuminata' phytoplasma TaxID=3239192 RepID=UPI003519FF04
MKKLNNEQKQKLILAILMLKNCHIIVAFEPAQNSNTKTKKTFFNHLNKLSQTKLVIVFTNDINEIHTLIEKQLIIQKNGFQINKTINYHNQIKTIPLNNYFNFEETKQLYLKKSHHLSDELTKSLSWFLFDFCPLPFELKFLATFLLRFRAPLISCLYKTLFAITTFFIIYFFYSPSIFFVCLLSFLILLVLLPVTFLFFSFWHRLEIKHTSILNKKHY